MERIFRTLRRAGIPRRDLYLAWDFTVASERSLARRMLSIRDRAFAELGDRNLTDLKVAGRAPALHDRQGRSTTRPPSSRTWPGGSRGT